MTNYWEFGAQKAHRINERLNGARHRDRERKDASTSGVRQVSRRCVRVSSSVFPSSHGGDVVT